MKKYEMTDETKVVMGHTLHRIRALKSFLRRNTFSRLIRCLPRMIA